MNAQPSRDLDLERQRELVRQTRAGDLDAYGELVLFESRQLRASLGRFVREPADLDDLVQDTFVRAHERLDQFDPLREFGPWLRQIGVNLALDFLRRQKRRAEVDEEDAGVEQLCDPSSIEDQAEHAELLAAFDAAVQELDADWAAVLRLRVLEEMSYTEIAETLDVRIGTVMSRLSRARSRIAGKLADRFLTRKGESS